MKRRLAGFLAVMLAGAMCLGFAACGETENENGGNGGNDESGGNGGSGENAQPALTKDTDFDALVSDKLTAEQWDAAFTNEAFSGCTSRHQMDGVPTTEMAFTYQKSGDVLTVQKTSSMPGAEGVSIVVLEENSVKEYSKMSGDFLPSGTAPNVWYLKTIGKDDAEWESYHSELNLEYYYSFHQGIAYDFAGEFDKFTYDETLHAYTYEGESIKPKYNPMDMMSFGRSIANATVKFSGGKLAYAKVRLSASSNDEIFTYYDYGKTQIAIPTETQPMPE